MTRQGQQTLHAKNSGLIDPDLQEPDLGKQDGRWWRFTAYDIRDGCVSPQSDADLLRFDPWQYKGEPVDKNRTFHPPYLEFLELSRLLAFYPTACMAYRPTEKSEALILEWSRRWGLLGILPAQAEVINLVPEWCDRRPGACQGGGWSVRFQRYVRRAGIWSAVDRTLDLDLRFEDTKAWEQQAKNTGLLPAPGAEVWHWEHHEFKHESVEEAVLPYFPAYFGQVMEAQAVIPRPNSVAFWRAYGEPLQLFAFWAVRFRGAVEIVSAYHGPEKATEGQLQSLNNALYFLEGLTQAIGNPPRYLPGSIQLTRAAVSPALLCSFAEMFLRDAEAGRRALRCERCGTFYVSSDPRARYCSRRCRTTIQRRRQRKREAERDTPASA